MATKAWCGCKIFRFNNKIVSLTAGGIQVVTYEDFKETTVPWMMRESVEKQGYFIEPEDAHMGEQG